MTKYVETKIARKALNECGFDCCRIYTEKRKNGVRCKIWYPKNKKGQNVRTKRDIEKLTKALSGTGYTIKMLPMWFNCYDRREFRYYSIELVKE